MSQTIRSFIAIDLPETVITAIRELQEEIRAYGFHIRWVRPENIHLTLKFLGDIKEDDREKITGAIFDSVKGFSPITLVAKGIGVFPGIKRPRIIWVGVSGDLEPLLGLQKRLEEALAGIGFEQENRRFKAHLTLGRIKGRIDPKPLGDALRAYMGFESKTFYADKIILYKSELRPTGAVYTKLVSAPLEVL